MSGQHATISCPPHRTRNAEALRAAARTFLVTGLFGAAASCWQRQRIVEDPSCSQLPIVRGQSREWRPRPFQDSTFRLMGEVVQGRGDSALAHALVIISTVHDSIRVQTGVDGRFRAALQGDTVVRMDIRRIGYERVLIPALRVRPDSLLRVPMQHAPMDGLCSGFAVLVKRRPWWHFW
jgi:hypothetical protein